MERSEEILDRLIFGPKIAGKFPDIGNRLLSLLGDQLLKSGVRLKVEERIF